MSTSPPTSIPLGRLAPLKMAAVPTFAGMLKYIGPGIVWAGLAQGSGELIWWPYLTAKYGAAFIGLLIRRFDAILGQHRNRPVHDYHR